MIDRARKVLSMSAKQRRWLYLIIALALVMRITHYSQMKSNNPVFDLPLVDSKEYVDDAHYYKNVSWKGTNDPYFHPPGYSYFVAYVMYFLNDSNATIKIVQIIMDVINTLLLFILARLLFNIRVAFFSAFIYAAYIRIIQFSVEILPPIMMIFLGFLSLICFIFYLRREKPTKKATYWLIASSVFLGLNIVTLPNYVFFLPIMGLVILSLTELKLAYRFKHILILGLIASTPVIITAMRNASVSDDTILISRNGGINLYIGNNLDVKKSIGARPGIEWQTMLMYPYENERVVSFNEQDKFWYREVGNYIQENPGHWIGLMLKKSVLFFNGFEFPRNFDLAFFARYSFITKLPVFKLHTILPLALAGLGLILIRFRKEQNLREKLLVIGILFSYALSIIIFFISARYRLPIIPILVMFSSFILVYLWDKFQEKKIKKLIMMIGIVAALAVLTNIKYFQDDFPYEIDPAHTYTLIGNVLMIGNQAQLSKNFFEQGIIEGINPACKDEVYYQLGHFYNNNGEEDKGKEAFLTGLENDPNNYEILNSLSFQAKMKREFKESIGFLKRAIKVAPCFPQSYLNLADSYTGQKKMDSAIIMLHTYFDNCPSPHPTISNSLALLYMEFYQDWEKALEQYLIGLKHNQGVLPTAEIYNRTGICYFNLRDYKNAKIMWQKGLELRPRFAPILQNMARLRNQSTY
ncbi:MAG: glycosyltransferase family 39 protein [Bacteroidetes bacterium]|nr:glycosyltransferase family 39 protein [Bacteroidota bacterium]